MVASGFHAAGQRGIAGRKQGPAVWDRQIFPSAERTVFGAEPGVKVLFVITIGLLV